MEQAEFIRTILAEREDDLPRLVFADWLEEHGQQARAAWIRASCQLARVRANDATFGELIELRWESFRLCRPEWWQDVPGVTQQNDRGIFRFRVESRAAVTKLGKLPWLGEAVADGWLEGISVEKCDESRARLQAKWPDIAQQVPLFVQPVPQISDAGLRFYLELPHLWGLDLPAYATRNPSIRLLDRRTDLRELNLKDVPTDGAVAPLMEQVGRLSGLRRLSVYHFRQATDDDLEPLSGLTKLRQLELYWCSSITDVSLARFCQLPCLRMLKLVGCERVTEAAIAEFRRSLPTLQIEQV
ncbi:TIGR02996 domain-containing protein [Tuwongella immobilis]|uniref:Repeat-companion domain protein n=1 Tax=Tuwongella immobilis TaxID=692036 RepID=A0A6C2YSN7_9BACT|nr:TIGR02996 domain-containing protein [Tuwongella immobilis]VIP04720.1 Putative uncharacterized protein OS=Protochlamydia amoebophila (strain UWE25) GN=pc1032 PE=4 SV=1 [Tuwongella immobilis]VTS06799.1 Putative uncharacterized protein OS=Protochlamydia amoebophila (strain UWE25) GN=pc1032 PE=4 SV=1 [Tuwongella immobilis]